MKVFLKKKEFEQTLAKANIDKTEFIKKMGITNTSLSKYLTKFHGVKADKRRLMMEILKVKDFNALFEMENKNEN